jgi:hypothetical protein
MRWGSKESEAERSKRRRQEVKGEQPSGREAWCRSREKGKRISLALLSAY